MDFQDSKTTPQDKENRVNPKIRQIPIQTFALCGTCWYRGGGRPTKIT